MNIKTIAITVICMLTASALTLLLMYALFRLGYNPVPGALGHIMRVNAANIVATATVLAVVITLLAIVGTGIFRLGELSTRVEQISNEVEQLPTREEVRILVAEEIRRSNQQLFHALANHTHDRDGNAVFTVSPL